LPENFPSLAPICNETLKLGEPISKEFNSGGSRFKLTCSPFFDMRGQMKGVTMVVSEFPGLAQELNLILDHGEIYMLNRAQDGTILRISEKSASFLGTTRQKAEGANFFKLAPQGIVKTTRALDAKLLDSKAEHLQEISLFRSTTENQERWLSVENFLFHGPFGDAPSIYTIGQDVSEIVNTRNKAEDALAQLMLLQELANVGFWSLDIENETVFWSEEVYRIHGKDTESFTPTLDDALAFYHPDDRDKVRAEVSRVGSAGGEFHFKRRIIDDGKNTVPVECFGLGRQDATGQVRRIIGVFRAMDTGVNARAGA
jgi:two-component system CheB/CheR fusion protein